MKGKEDRFVPGAEAEVEALVAKEVDGRAAGVVFKAVCVVPVVTTEEAVSVDLEAALGHPAIEDRTKNSRGNPGWNQIAKPNERLVGGGSIVGGEAGEVPAVKFVA